MSFKINLISYSFSKGGAGIAAKKFSMIAQSQLNYPVREYSIRQRVDVDFLKRVISFLLVKLQQDNNPIKHSLNLFSSRKITQLFKQTPRALFHLHWINNDVISIFDLNKIPSGSIVTLHDEWFYCGAEHCYKVSDNNLDFVTGYQWLKKGVWGINWNYIVWNAKFKKLANRKDIIFTVPSHWMLERAKSSKILKGCDVRLLHNPIDTDIFHKKHSKDCITFRKKNDLSNDEFLICFGAVNPKSFYKGGHLLKDALKHLKLILDEKIPKNIKLIIFGAPDSTDYGFDTVHIGYIQNPNQLALIYSSVNCVIVPSIVESFGQVAAEAGACESPVICFNCSGLRDIVVDGKTGFMAKPYMSSELADKIKLLMLMSKDEQKVIGNNARKHILEHFSIKTIASKYKTIISDAGKLTTNYKA